MPEWGQICRQLAASGVDVDDRDRPLSVAGGDISAAWRLESSSGRLFLKTGPRDAGDMFVAEAEGLRELGSANAVRVPCAIAHGVAGGTAYIALEWLPFSNAEPDTHRLLGEQLAALHRHTADRFGWYRDNTIGSTPQRNPLTCDWAEFFGAARLGFQFELARRNGYRGELEPLGAALIERLPEFFEDYEPVPSLLHGDLWGGNWACVDGKPVIFDPAVYYGDRETDLAMTRLFGGFSPDFYSAYEKTWPLAPGSDRRIPLYQLYHVLNHLNMFGRSYLGRAESLLRELVRQK